MDYMPRHWYDDEVRALLNIWCAPGTQKQLENTSRNKEVYTLIAQRLRAMGYHRDWTQCRVKIKNLKYEYRAAKDGTFRGGPSHLARCMRFYDEMDRVMGKKGSSQPASIQDQDRDEKDPGISVLQLALTRGQVPHIKMEVEDGHEGEGETNLDLDPPSDGFFQTGLTARSPPPHLPPAATSASPEQLLLDHSGQAGPSILGIQTLDIPISGGEDSISETASTSCPPDISRASTPCRARRPGGQRRSRNRPRGDNLSRTLERITGLFLRHERLSEEKYYRWEAQQRQMERLHELRMVSTVIQGLQGIMQPLATPSDTNENNTH